MIFINSLQTSYLKALLTSTSLVSSYLSRVINLKAIRACIIIHLVILLASYSVILAIVSLSFKLLRLPLNNYLISKLTIILLSLLAPLSFFIAVIIFKLQTRIVEKFNKLLQTIKYSILISFSSRYPFVLVFIEY